MGGETEIVGYEPSTTHEGEVTSSPIETSPSLEGLAGNERRGDLTGSAQPHAKVPRMLSRL